MDLKQLVSTLHPLERQIVPYLLKAKDEKELQAASGMLHIEVVRCLQWLENKGVVVLTKNEVEHVTLGINGKRAAREGLPEQKFLAAVAKKDLSIGDIGKAAKLEKQEVNVCIGLLRRKGHITFEKGIVSITDSGKTSLEGESAEEQLLKKLPLQASELNDDEQAILKELSSRKEVVETKTNTVFSYTVTDLGKKLTKEDLSGEVVDKVTSSMLSSGEWKGKDIRRYDVSVGVPAIYGGKRHFVRQTIDYTKRIWLEMGFKEMNGGSLQTSFWNFDALFTAQDHPVREMQDTFFIAEPSHGKLPDPKIVAAVKAVHENGGNTGATGWGGEWSEEDAKRNVLRTHTTVLSVPTLASLGEEDLPAKFFSVGKCFRNETLDWCHLFEFNQTEGIVVDPKANFRHLLGYLKAFYLKMGFEKVRFRPAYFPYTEPSVEVDVYHPVHKTWVELGGAGIFRPEVVMPLMGKDITVLAWGQGLGRVLSDYYKITDIRDLYKNDLKQIREMKVRI